VNFCRAWVGILKWAPTFPTLIRLSFAVAVDKSHSGVEIQLHFVTERVIYKALFECSKFFNNFNYQHLLKSIF